MEYHWLQWLQHQCQRLSVAKLQMRCCDTLPWLVLGAPWKYGKIVCLFFLPISRHSLNMSKNILLKSIAVANMSIYHISITYIFSINFPKLSSEFTSQSSQPPPWHHRIRCTASWNGLKRWWTSRGDDLTVKPGWMNPTGPPGLGLQNHVEGRVKVGSTARWCPIAKLDSTILYLGQVESINL